MKDKGGGGGLGGGRGAADLVVAELGGQAGVFVVREGYILGARRRRFVGEVMGLDVDAVVVEGMVRVPQGLVWVEVRPGAGGKVREHLLQEVVVGSGVEVRGGCGVVELVVVLLVLVVIVHVRVLDLSVVVVEVLERDLRRVEEGVYSLHFSATGLHNRPKLERERERERERGQMRVRDGGVGRSNGKSLRLKRGTESRVEVELERELRFFGLRA